jgi:hypothetical protein
LKLFQEWGERRIKKNDGEGEINYDIYDIFANATMYLYIMFYIVQQ